jgi:hypothetical protein
MTSGKGYESLAYDPKPGVRSVDDGAGRAFDGGREGLIELGVVRRIENEEVLPDRLRSPSISWTWNGAFMLLGFTTKAINLAFGASSRSR